MFFPVKNLIGKKEIIFFVFLNLIFFAPVKAADVVMNNPSAYNSIQEVVGGVSNWILSVAAAITILFLIIGGIYYITAAGDEKQMGEGKKIINYAVIGLVIILISYSLVLTINEIIF